MSIYADLYRYRELFAECAQETDYQRAYKARRTLRLGVELSRQLRRRRTQLVLGFLVLEGFDFGVGMLLPFLPRNDRPVYCSNCFDKVRARA